MMRPVPVLALTRERARVSESLVVRVVLQVQVMTMTDFLIPMIPGVRNATVGYSDVVTSDLLVETMKRTP